jgi:hypothetical protein
MFDKQYNPYYRLLMRGQAARRKERRKRRSRWIQVFIILGAVPIIFSEAFMLSCGCSLLSLLLPIMAATTIAQISASATRSGDYELITITPLPDDDILWGQFHSTLDHHLHSRQIPYGMVPIAFAFINIGLVLSIVIEENGEWAAIPAVIAMVLSFTGIYWLLGLSGAAIGLATRRPGLSSWITAGISLVTIFVWGITFISLPDPNDSLAEYVLFAVVPYIPITPTIFLAYRFARNPVISPPSI